MAVVRNHVVVLLFFLTLACCLGAMGADWFTVWTMGTSVLDANLLSSVNERMGTNPVSFTPMRSDEEFFTVHGMRHWHMRHVIDARLAADSREKIFSAAIVVSIYRYYWSQSGYERCYLDWEERQDNLNNEFNAVKALMDSEQTRVCELLKKVELDGCDDSYHDLTYGIMGQHWRQKALCGAMGAGVFSIVIVCAILSMLGMILCLVMPANNSPIKYTAFILVVLLCIACAIYVSEAEAWIGTTYDLDYSAAMMATNGVRTFQAGAGLAAFAAFLSFVNFVYLQIWGFQSSGEVKPSKIRESPLELVEERIQSRDMDAPVYKAGSNGFAQLASANGRTSPLQDPMNPMASAALMFNPAASVASPGQMGGPVYGPGGGVY